MFEGLGFAVLSSLCCFVRLPCPSIEKSQRRLSKRQKKLVDWHFLGNMKCFLCNTAIVVVSAPLKVWLHELQVNISLLTSMADSRKKTTCHTLEEFSGSNWMEWFSFNWAKGKLHIHEFRHRWVLSFHPRDNSQRSLFLCQEIHQHPWWRDGGDLSQLLLIPKVDKNDSGIVHRNHGGPSPLKSAHSGMERHHTHVAYVCQYIQLLRYKVFCFAIPCSANAMFCTLHRFLQP